MMRNTKQTSLPAGWIESIANLNRWTRRPRATMRDRYSFRVLAAIAVAGFLFLASKGLTP